MNSLERSIIEKAGYDNGWEVVLESGDLLVELESSLHSAKAKIEESKSSKWAVCFDESSITIELKRLRNEEQVESFQVFNDFELGELLSQAARFARALPNQPEKRFKKELSEAIAKEELGQTELERLVKQRIGQNIFRDSLIDYWNASCSVTGIQIPETLRASHIKSWADCDSDSERLNVYNGLLLTANLDALFDKHMISFEDSGKIIIAPKINANDLNDLSLLGIHENVSLKRVSQEHFKFLKHHRQKQTQKHK